MGRNSSSSSSSSVSFSDKINPRGVEREKVATKWSGRLIEGISHVSSASTTIPKYEWSISMSSSSSSLNDFISRHLASAFRALRRSRGSFASKSVNKFQRPGRSVK
ncbi:unnamed protein product [Pseudo-nitzschia multistriata]|uniref:Uncharacterized protein n=1 Tax=Pseudo-nitzschia multistriata TaxID=183589 RepID=A0A448ZCE3_9STRA|nr:unnamed protein product [Pseudo-nitzschia multistriata]